MEIKSYFSKLACLTVCLMAFSACHDKSKDGGGINSGTTSSTTFILTVTKSGTGNGTISGSPGGINNCSAICTASFPSGTPVTLTAVPGTGSNFTGWSDPSCPGISPCVFTITENKSVIATFGTTGGGGGSGDSDGTIATATPLTLPTPAISGTIDPLGDVDFFRFSASAGSRVAIDIDAAVTGSTLDSFLRLFNSSGVEISSNDDEASSRDSFIDHVLSTTGNYFISVSASSDKSTGAYTLEVALDVSQAEPTLTVTKSGTGNGTISSSPTGINNCSAICTASFPSGTPVTLTAVPGTGSNFTGWSDPSCIGISPCAFTITVNKSVIATFGPSAPNPTPPPPPDPSGVFGSLSISGGGASVVGESFVPKFRGGSLSNIPSIGDSGLLTWSKPNGRGNHPSLDQDTLSLAIFGETIKIQFQSVSTAGSGTSVVIQVVRYSLDCGVPFPEPTPASIIECEKISINTAAKTITFNNTKLEFSSVRGGSIINSGPIILKGRLIWQ